MITNIQKNLLKVERGIICHQVNCQGIASAGLALQIRSKWPGWYKEYRATSGYLGLTTWYRADSELLIASLYAQDGYGRGKRYTNYAALGKCLLNVKRVAEAKVYLPKGIGCGLGGGDWQIVKQIIEDALPSVIIVELFQSLGRDSGC